MKEIFLQTISFKHQNFTKEHEHVKIRFPHAIDSIINHKLNQLSNLQKMLESNNPKFKSRSGFAQISQNSKVINLSSLNVDDIFDIQSAEINIRAKVLQKSNIKEKK